MNFTWETHMHALGKSGVLNSNMNIICLKLIVIILCTSVEQLVNTGTIEAI